MTWCGHWKSRWVPAERRGGVGLVFWDRLKGWSVELTRFHGWNMVSCNIIAVDKLTLIIGAYLLPSTLEHLTYLEEALTQLKYQYPIVLGEINYDHGTYGDQV